MMLSRLAELQPKRVLDVGCGYGEFTARMSPYCGSITAIDVSEPAIDRSWKESMRPNIEYVHMDGRHIDYPDNSFDMALERVSLHHILEWEQVLDEMIRVSSKYVLLEEPVDDLRSEGKRNAILGQRLYLKVQTEVGYSHFEHIKPESLVQYFRTKGITIETEVEKSDELIDFDEFFSAFGYFAKKTDREEYWYGRLADLKTELSGKPMSKCDIILIQASV